MYGMVATAWFLTAAPAGAQPAATQPSSAPAELEAIRLAEQPYADASFGFSLRPFDDCEIKREKRIDAEGDLEVAMFANYNREWVMTVHLRPGQRARTLEDWLSVFREKLARKDPEAKVLRQERLTLHGRDAWRFAASLSAARSLWLHQTAIIQSKPEELLEIVFDSPLRHREVAEPLFDEVVRSVEFLRTQAVQQLLDDALLRSPAWLRALATDGRLGEKLTRESYLRILVDDKDTGYLWTREFGSTLDRREGVGLRQEGWIFESDGTVKRQLTEMFLAKNLRFEKWNTMAEVIIPPRAPAPAQRLITYEKGLREDSQLMVAYSSSANPKDVKDRTIETPESYAPVALLSLFPQVVDLGKPELYAFVSYSTERRGLILRTLRVMGQQTVIANGRSVRATRIDDSEGLVPPAAELYVDERGQLVKMVSGKLQMLATDEKKIASLYDNRIEAARQVAAQIEEAVRKADKTRREPRAPAPRQPEPARP